MSDRKAAVRKSAGVARKAAHARGAGDACEHLVKAITALAPNVIAGYWPIHSEIDPRPAIERLSTAHEIVLPVVPGPDLALEFRLWTPGARMIAGAFGAAIPAENKGAVPDVLIVPLLAFDSSGYRLGYGGGFYDRTLAELRSMRPTFAVGFGYSAQEMDEIPTEPTDQPLDVIVTEQEIRRFA